MNFQFCYFRNISGQDHTEKHAPAWILLDLSKEMSFNYDLVLRASESPLYPRSLDLAPELKMGVSGEGSVSTSKLHLSTAGTQGKGPWLSWEEQECYLCMFLKFPRKSTFFSPQSFSRANLSSQHGRWPAQGVTGLNWRVLTNPPGHKHCTSCSSKGSRRIRSKFQFRHWSMTSDRSPVLSGLSFLICLLWGTQQNIYCSTWEGRAWHVSQISPSKVLMRSHCYGSMCIVLLLIWDGENPETHWARSTRLLLPWL